MSTTLRTEAHCPFGSILRVGDPLGGSSQDLIRLLLNLVGTLLNLVPLIVGLA
jgi:hypothetical protein